MILLEFWKDFLYPPDSLKGIQYCRPGHLQSLKFRHEMGEGRWEFFIFYDFLLFFTITAILFFYYEFLNGYNHAKFQIQHLFGGRGRGGEV